MDFKNVNIKTYPLIQEMVSDHLPHLLYSTSRKQPFKCRMQACTLYSSALEEHTTVSIAAKQQKTQAFKGLLIFLHNLETNSNNR